MSRDLIPAWVGDALTPVDKLEVHRRGLRHPAVSVFVTDPQGRILLQRRALGKYHSGGLWANTCCTHAHWDEAPDDCALRRLDEELGITGLSVTAMGEVEYRAEVGNGMTEHEVVALFHAPAPADLRITPDPSEVMETRWITLPDLLAALAARPQDFTAWLQIYLTDHAAQLAPVLGPSAAAT